MKIPLGEPKQIVLKYNIADSTKDAVFNLRKYESCLTREAATLEQLKETKLEVKNQQNKIAAITSDYNQAIDDGKIISAKKRKVEDELYNTKAELKNSKRRKNGVILTLIGVTLVETILLAILK